MQAQSPPGAQTPPTPVKLPAMGGGGKGNPGMVLGAIALAVALIAAALVFVIPGPTGPAGGLSSSGVPSVSLWVVSDQNGVIARSSGVDSVTNVSSGHYQVLFGEILTDCTFSASLATIAYGTEPGGWATVSMAYHSLNTTNVTTYNATGVVTPMSFHVVAVCPGGLSAVVASNGTYVDGYGVNWTVRSGVGVYYVVFDQSVAGCAYIFGLGEGGSPPPGSVTGATLGINNNGVWVDTYNANGANANQSFHVNVYC